MKFFYTLSYIAIGFYPLLIQGQNNEYTVTAYYAGNAEKADSFAIEKLTHIIFSFCHLKGNQLAIDDALDSATIKKLVGLKSRKPALKVLLSLGGWAGCQTCSPVFSDPKGRKEFARSVRDLCISFKADGIDLDWEYPTVPGPPGHPYSPADKNNFTDLIKELRKSLGKNREISFAAGGFKRYMDEAVDWKAVMPLVDRVYLMTYDFVHPGSKVTGHHTSLYSTSGRTESADYAVQYLMKLGIPSKKLVIGAAFYARVFDAVENVNNGLFQPGKQSGSIPYKDFPKELREENGYIYHWDSVAQAPFYYNEVKKKFVTLDDQKSVQAKTTYVIKNNLNGIMFWELSKDSYSQGLLEVIDYTIKSRASIKK